MTSSSSVVPLRQPDTINDPLTAMLRSGARRLLAQAIEAEAEAFLATMKGARLPDGRERLVRDGHGPERQVQTGIGAVAVQRARLRDRGAGEVPGRTASASRRRSCRVGPGGRAAWMPCCRSSICAACRWVTCRKRSGRCSAATPRTCRRR